MSSSILRFWGVGVRSWRYFLLLLIAVREFEDSDFLLRVQMVLFHYAWRLNNVFWEWMSFVATLSQASWSILYLWEKQSDWKTILISICDIILNEYSSIRICFFYICVPYLLAQFSHTLRFEFIFYNPLFHVKLMLIWW